MHEKEELGHLLSEENLIKVEKSLRKRFKVSERGFERWKVKRDRAKISLRLQGPFIYKLSNSQQIERCRSLKGLTDVAIKQVSKAKRSLMDRGSVEELLRGQKVSQLIHLAIKRCRDSNKKQLKSSIDKLGIERCRGAIEIT